MLLRRGVALAAVVLGVLAGAGTAGAMSGGTPAPRPSEAPWLVTFAARGDAPLLRRASCGGTLVAPDRVLTAAHCLDGVDRRIVEVHIGASRLSSNPGTMRTVRGVRIVPGYAILPSPAAPDDPELSSARDDLAVVTLDRPARGIPVLRPVRTAPAPGTVGTFYGHGITTPSSGSSDTLQRGRLRVRPDATCAALTPATVDGPSVLCTVSAGRRRVQGCFGDSGGPLVVRDGAGRAKLAGVFSFAMETAGKPCGAPGFNAFADVTVLGG